MADGKALVTKVVPTDEAHRYVLPMRGYTEVANALDAQGIRRKSVALGTSVVRKFGLDEWHRLRGLVDEEYGEALAGRGNGLVCVIDAWATPESVHELVCEAQERLQDPPVTVRYVVDDEDDAPDDGISRMTPREVLADFFGEDD